MEFQEYPKALYRNGDYIAVADAAEEKAQRADGYDDWLPDHERSQAGVTSAADTQYSALTRDELKEQAAALGLTYARNISTAQLAELVAAAPKA